jgi:hypothetical protein
MKACLDTLKSKVIHAAKKAAPRPASKEQIESVQNFKREADSARREQKELRSLKKTSRSLDKNWKRDF